MTGLQATTKHLRGSGITSKGVYSRIRQSKYVFLRSLRIHSLGKMILRGDPYLNVIAQRSASILSDGHEHLDWVPEVFSPQTANLISEYELRREVQRLSVASLSKIVAWEKLVRAFSFPEHFSGFFSATMTAVQGIQCIGDMTMKYLGPKACMCGV